MRYKNKQRVRNTITQKSGIVVNWRLHKSPPGNPYSVQQYMVRHVGDPQPVWVSGWALEPYQAPQPLANLQAAERRVAGELFNDTFNKFNNEPRHGGIRVRHAHTGATGTLVGFNSVRWDGNDTTVRYLDTRHLERITGDG